VNLPNREIAKWVEDAACSQTDPELWFPDRGQSAKMAKKICSNCPVLWDCRIYSLSERLEHGPTGLDGIWGGLSMSERSKTNSVKQLLQEALEMATV
jgi:WhiB family transcriptional regulator, redox-sensing transcriptional regulator